MVTESTREMKKCWVNNDNFHASSHASPSLVYFRKFYEIWLHDVVEITAEKRNGTRCRESEDDSWRHDVSLLFELQMKIHYTSLARHKNPFIVECVFISAPFYFSWIKLKYLIHPQAELNAPRKLAQFAWDFFLAKPPPSHDDDKTEEQCIVSEEGEVEMIFFESSECCVM